MELQDERRREKPMFASVQEIAVLHCEETRGMLGKLLISHND